MRPALSVPVLAVLLFPMESLALEYCTIGGVSRLCDTICDSTGFCATRPACDQGSQQFGAENDGFCVVCGNNPVNTIAGATVAEVANGVRGFICAKGGDDIITSNGGDNTIDASSGNDQVTAGDGATS
jgi:hypothetical protein